MIISKKKLNQMMQEAVSKREKELTHERALEDEFRYIRDDIRDTRNDMYRITDGLYARVTAIEKELHPEKFKNNNNNVETSVPGVY